MPPSAEASLAQYLPLAKQLEDVLAGVDESESQVGTELFRHRKAAHAQMVLQMQREGGEIKQWARTKAEEALQDYFGADVGFSIQTNWITISSERIFSCKIYCNQTPKFDEEPDEDGTLPSFRVLNSAMSLKQDNQFWFTVEIDLKRYGQNQ